MYKKLKYENQQWESSLIELKITAPLSSSQFQKGRLGFAANALRFSGNALAWLFSASLTRIVGGGERALERHEFEVIELKRGGFGEVF